MTLPTIIDVYKSTNPVRGFWSYRPARTLTVETDMSILLNCLVVFMNDVH